MGTISDKLEYLNDTKGLLKDKINNLGGSIDDNTTFRQYANQLQNVYDNLPKTEYQEGTDITIENGLKGKLDFDDGKVGFGQASQDSTQGYNLLPPPYETAELNGIKLTNNGDGTYILNGTSTAQAIFWGTNFKSKNIYGEKFVGCPSNWSTAWGYCQIQYDDNSYSGEEKGSGVTLDNSKKIYRTALVIRNGITLNSVVIKLMVTNDTTKTYNDFEKYSGGYASPSPNWEQEIEVVRGKNRLNFSIVGKVPSVNGGGLVDSPYGATTELIPIYGEDYTLSYSATGAKPYIFYYGDNNTFLGSANQVDSGYTISTSIYFSSAKHIRIRTDNFSVLNNTNTQLTKGSQATSYLPYNTLEVVERGKNEADPNNIILGKSLGTSGELTPMTARATLFENSIKPNTQYHLSIDNNYQIGNLFYYNQDKTYLTVQGSAWGNNKTTTTPSNAYYISFATKKIDDTTMTESDIEKLQIQLEEGTTATDYEPYQTPQTYQLSLGEYEFAKIGNYVDTIEYDVDEDKVYKNENVLKIYGGALNWSRFVIQIGGQNANLLRSESVTNLLKNSEGKSNFYTCLTQGTRTNPCFYINVDNPYIDVVDNNYETGESFKSYCSTNNIVFYAPALIPTKKEITGTLKDQIKALYNSQSFTGTTIITSNGNLPMIIKVRGLKGE